MPTEALNTPAHAAASPRLLVVDDEPDLRTLYELTLVREGYDVESAASVEEGWALLQQRGPGGYQLVITDMRLPDGSGLDLLRRIDDAGRREKAIVITAYGSPENAVEALKAGAYDYLTKPVDLRQFRAVVASALGRMPGLPGAPSASSAPAAAPRTAPSGDGRGDGRNPARQHASLDRIAGSSAAMQQVRSLVERVARSMAPVLVHGESGTGKELVARAIHEVSPRGAMPFVAVNCGAIPEALLEAEFFGYRKGAFTGAHEDREGFFQAAQGGTLFLDEIGDLPLQMQSKLLRVIQERALRPLGAVAEAPINVRIVSATHKDLGAEVQGGRFRQDLYYRLNVIRIAVPPLRERLADLPAICASVLQRIARDAGVQPVPTLAPDALQHLLRYSFPGNVRELENLLHRALALATAPIIGLADLGLPEELMHEAVVSDAEAGVTVAPPVPASLAAAGAPAALPSDLAAYLDTVEREILERALERHRYNRTAAGASLGLSLRQMRYRMARLGVGAADSADPA
jgi:two-component system response regulator PilR (NtrC family)